MRDSRAAPEPAFGQIDLDLEDDPRTTVRPPLASSTESFGQIDFDVGDAEEAAPPSNSRVFNTEKNRPTRRNLPAVSARPAHPTRKVIPAVHDASTRIFKGDALVAATRPPPSPLEDDGDTRAWAEVDEALLSVGEDDAVAPAPPPSRSARQPSSVGSGVATRDDFVAAMRELYASGDAEGALALGATIGQSVPPPAGVDHRDASVMIELGEQSIDVDDPFGGLIPIDDELAAMPTAPPARLPLPPPPPGPPCAAPHLTLTERHSIPRLLKSMAEVSKLKIDHRAGFLLAHVDGMQTLEEILDICAMPATEALGLISNLRAMGVIEFE